MGRTLNVFRLTNGRIEYTDAIKAAVLDPRITGLKLHMNGGWDWIDSKFMFVKLLLKRGQIESIETHSDLLARQDYIEAAALGRGLRSISFDTTTRRRLVCGTGRAADRKTVAYASILRCQKAEERFQREFKQVIKTKGA